MKARIKETGEIIEVEDLYDDGNALVKGTYFKVSQLDFFNDFETTDWEQRRYELAKSFATGIVSSHTIEDLNNSFIINDYGYEVVADLSIKLADAFIKRLKGESL